MSKKSLKFAYFFVGLFFSAFALLFVGKAWPGVFQCMGANGVKVFRDRPCLPEEKEQEFLPLTYKKTDPNLVMLQDRMIKKALQQDSQQQKKEERIRLRTEKKRAEEKLKLERRLKRCQRLDEKLEEIAAQMRKPCKPKRMQRLQDQKEHCLKMKQRYCQSEQPST